MGELHSLVILHLVSVNVGFTEVDPRFAQRGLVQYSFRESLAIHVELEQDVLPSLDVLTGMNGYSGAEQHQFVIGRNDGIGHAGPVDVLERVVREDDLLEDALSARRTIHI